jgi:5-methylthioadenosine/S-adenosylhomocysteine deaminase
MYNPVSHIIYTVQASDVRDVIVSGRILVRDQNLLTLNLEDTLKKIAAISRMIKES